MLTHVYGNIILSSQRMETTQMPISKEWMNKMQYIHAVEYYSAVKRNKALIHATVSISFENLMLREGSPPQKATRDMIPLSEMESEMLRAGKIQTDRK